MSSLKLVEYFDFRRKSTWNTLYCTYNSVMLHSYYGMQVRWTKDSKGRIQPRYNNQQNADGRKDHLFALEIGVLEIVLLPGPVPVVRLEPPAGGDVPVPVGSQVPLAHHVRGEVEAGVEVLGEQPELERQGVRLGRQNDAVLKACKPTIR